MDRLTQLRGEAGSGGSRDSSLDSSPASEAYVTANSSKYFSLSEEDSSYDLTPIKHVSLSSAADPNKIITGNDELISNLSPIQKKSDLLDSYKIGKQIEAANILSGGVDIFEDNDNSYDGHELVIDDNVVEIDEKSNTELQVAENANLPFQKAEDVGEPPAVENEPVASKETEWFLQIDGRSIKAIDLGNGLYLYRNEGQEELAAVQIIDDGQQEKRFKFLKVRDNDEGNLELYEEIAVPMQVPAKGGKAAEKIASSVRIKGMSMRNSDPASDKDAGKNKSQVTEISPAASTSISSKVSISDSQSDSKYEPMNGKMTELNETKKSPVIHSTPNKEGIPLTKTMVDLHLHPNRHSDNVKTIEVHTDSKHKQIDVPTKVKDSLIDNKTPEKISDSQGKPATVGNSDAVTAGKINETKETEKNTIEKERQKDNKTVEKFEIIKPDLECTQVAKISTTDQNLGKDLVGQEKIKDLKDAKVAETPKTNPIVLDEAPLEVEAKCSSSKTNDKSTLLNKMDVNEIQPSKKASPVETTGTDFAGTSEEVEKVEVKATPQNSESKINREELLLEKKGGSLMNEVSSIIMKGGPPKTVKNLEPKKRELINDLVGSASLHDKHSVSSPSKVTIESTEANLLHNLPNNLLSNTSNNILKKFETANVSCDKQDNVPKRTIIKEEIQGDLNQPKPNKNVEITDQMEVHDKKPVAQVAANVKTPPESGTNAKEDITKNILPNKESANVSGAIKKLPIKTDPIPESSQKSTLNKSEIKDENSKDPSNVEQKVDNNNHAAVPFGKWTEANRQEFLNKFKESKVQTNTSNSKQLKQPNDLNRRDVLQKIDSQRERQSNNAIAKAQELSSKQVKTETKTFNANNSKIPVKLEAVKNKPAATKVAKQETVSKPKDVPNTPATSSAAKSEVKQRKEINAQDLIDKTIEGIINRALPGKASQQDIDTKQSVTKDVEKNKKEIVSFVSFKPGEKDPTSLDAIESQMNELHGIPFVERPPHELPRAYNVDVKSYSKSDKNPNASVNKVPNLIPYINKNQPKVARDNVVEIDSEEEIIENEPITGDMELNKKDVIIIAPKVPVTENVVIDVNTNATKKEAIITEKEFDKFARRNSITYENCLTVNFDGNQPHNVIQTVVERELPMKKYSRNELLLAEAKTKSTHKQSAMRPNKISNKIQMTSKLVPVSDDAFNKSNQSKLQMAYQSAMTAKRHMESPITIIEDKPVKVVFMDSNSEFMSTNLNVAGSQLSPVKKPIPDLETFTINDSMDSDLLDAINEGKSQDESKVKTKHQRKQVLTPVETPELELIVPSDLILGKDASPKKKRKTEDIKMERSPKSLVPRKSYLLGRTSVLEMTVPQDLTKNPLKDSLNQNNTVISHNDAASAIDNLVKAAELLETQSETLNSLPITVAPVSVTPQVSPVKRGRGRPRKYPLPDGAEDLPKIASPQKKPRLIDAKPLKRATSTDDDSSDDGIIQENWTMGKINENIVCPICSKLFRSENVVFKHVKHCTGPSPNRSDSDNRSPRRSRQSLESESKSRSSRSDDMEVEADRSSSRKNTPKKRKSKDVGLEFDDNKEDVIVIEDTPMKGRLDRDESKHHVSRKAASQSKLRHRTTSLECNVCGKSFRQLSYLASHKLQHKKEDVKKPEDTQTSKSVFSCEVCKKEFRKLYHLAQHRIIHNPTIPSRSTRKISSEQSDKRVAKEQEPTKPSDDQNAAYRCEPCDKSFRKLHHLVEHRETHDGINRQKKVSTPRTSVDKPASADPPQCDICKKTFRKLHHLIEHKEQHHVDTSSDKSDDKSIKSSLSRDIIHECSLCYMVFPNEHSLNKHFGNCQRKKRQSAAKQAAESKPVEESSESSKPEETNLDAQERQSTVNEEIEPEKDVQSNEISEPPVVELVAEVAKISIKRISKEIETKPVESKPLPKIVVEESVDSNAAAIELSPEIPEKTVTLAKIKKIVEKPEKEDTITVIPKRKSSVKDKVAPNVTKRQKSSTPLPTTEEVKPETEVSDDEEVRYMLNPDFRLDNTEGTFLKVKANKRNSLLIERPKDKYLVRRTTSSQHPPKIPRLKAKAIEVRVPSRNSVTMRSVVKATKPEFVVSDTEDNEVKYSFPKSEKPQKVASESKIKTPKEMKSQKVKRKSLVEKRKSLSGIAKRKSVGRPVTVKHQPDPITTMQVKRRTIGVEHRCDCGELFSSATLLSRHTTLAHTPPRIRRRRSPPPESAKTIPLPPKPSVSDKPKTTDSRKSSVRSDTSSRSTRKSNAVDPKQVTPKRKSVSKTESTAVKATRSAVHRGVPVPEKMRKLMEKEKTKKGDA